MYCNASLLMMIFIILIQTLQHDIDACLLQSMFIECSYMSNVYECVWICFVFLSGFEGNLKISTVNNQWKHDRICRQGPLLYSSQDSNIFITDLSSSTLIVNLRVQINVFEVTLQEENYYGNQNSVILVLEKINKFKFLAVNFSKKN